MLSKKLLFVALFVVVLAATYLTACKKDSTGPMRGKDNTAFNAYEDHFLEALWKVDPDWATTTGYHKYDSLLVIPNAKSRDAMLNFVKVQNDSIARFEINELSETNRIDYRIMQNQLEYLNWKLVILKEYEWDPSSYNVIRTFGYMLNEHYAPLAKRLRNFYEKMANVPDYYKQVQKELKSPVSELTDLAIEQHTNGLNIFEKDFADSLKRSTIPSSDQKKMLDRAHAAVEAIKGYTAWLKTMKNDKPRGFRLGKEFYEDKFKYVIQSSANAQQTYNAAVDRKKYLHREMTKLSRQLWPKYFGKKAMPADSLDMIASVIDTLSGKHVRAAEFQSTIESQIPKLLTFVKIKDLVTLDPTKPLIVRKEPGYMSGVAVASMSPPGPYDKQGNFYFNVGNISGSSPESFLREYNNYTLQLLCIHEGVPGHYVQQVYAQKSPSLIKSIFGGTSMAEGWAVYSEQMMLDNGYDDSPEMRLMWYKWHLRSVCNTILDYSVHNRDMTKEQAVKMLTHEAFQEQAEADGKWKRVSVTSVQLDSYYSGYKEIVDLRDAYKTKMGDKYKLRDFNEKFLSYGNAPVKYIKAVMLGK
ncbi:MAG TPA: DUF885 domain-containing protein [Mucilaginibacter sp.]